MVSNGIGFPPTTLPTELVTAVGPLFAAPVEGQIAFDKKAPENLPLGVATHIEASGHAQ